MFGPSVVCSFCCISPVGHCLVNCGTIVMVLDTYVSYNVVEMYKEP